MEVLEITEKEFDEKIKNGLVLIDCYALWCGPCKMLSPIVDEVASEVSDCSFYKINIDDADAITERFGIMSIPTLLLFKNGELVKKSVGLISKDELIKLINEVK